MQLLLLGLLGTLGCGRRDRVLHPYHCLLIFVCLLPTDLPLSTSNYLHSANRCINARRRRKRGMSPMYGTGWIPAGGPKNNYQNHGGYYNNQPYNGAPAPPYSGPSNGIPSQQTGTTFNSNDGYYGNHNNSYGQQQGVELQPPQNAYHGQRGGDTVYEAPHGAPPSKGDGIIR